jgi:kynureninase
MALDTTVQYAKRWISRIECALLKMNSTYQRINYMDGNSLGLMSKRSEATLEKLVASWRERGIDGWTEGEDPGLPIRKSLVNAAKIVGANGNEVMVTGSITVNIHQMFSTLFHPTPENLSLSWTN